MKLPGILNIKENEFKASWAWFQNIRTQKGLKAVLMFGEGAEVDKTASQLLESVDKLYEIIRMYPPSCVYNIDETGLFTGFYPIIPYSYQMKMYQLSEGQRNQKFG